jgi:hypothetical protein
MDAYEWTLVGLMAFGTVWTPVVIVAWLNPTSGMTKERSDLTRVMPAYQPVTEDIAGSVGIAVARTTGQRVTQPLKVVYVYAARHARNAWQRPSNFVRRHAVAVTSSRAYRDTRSSLARGYNWVTDTTYRPRHMKMGIA